MNSKISYLKPKNDFVFKALFGREDNECKTLLISFLNALFKLKEFEKIIEIEYLNPFNLKEYSEDKLSILDIKVRTETGERINIEMQVRDTDNYRKRSLYYWSRLYGETISESEAYNTLKKCIIVNILDFNLLHETGKYHSLFKIRDIDEGYVLTDDLEIHYIELEKFNDAKSVEDMDLKELWVTFIKDAGEEGKEEIIEQIKERSEINMAVEMLRKISSDEIMRQKFLDREKARLDYKSQLHYAEEKGIEKGIEKGRIEGKIEGSIEEARSVLSRLLKKKFQEVSPRCINLIDLQTNIIVINNIIDNIFDINSEEEILKLLQTNTEDCD